MSILTKGSSVAMRTFELSGFFQVFCKNVHAPEAVMISGLYGAATAMDVAAQRHEVAARNLAHVQMAGYRRQMIPQSPFDMMLREAGADHSQDEVLLSEQLGTASRGIHTDFTQGSMRQTGRSLDLAISGDGFFHVNGPEGPLYTRNGSFYVNPQGQLVTVDQLPVMGTGGPITIPPGATTESLRLSSDGRLFSNGVDIGQLELIRFNNVQQLQPAGATLFSATEEAGASPSDSEVLQGYLEQANVTSIDELVNLVAISREYEAAQKALNTLAESIQKRIGLR
ncbi:MAG: flagellar hook-basal body protein [Planctomyces sp.]